MPSGCDIFRIPLLVWLIASCDESYIRMGRGVYISAWASTLYWRCISVVHSKMIFLICYLLDYQQVHDNANVSIILLGDKKEPTKWKTNPVQQILLLNNHFPCYFYFKNHFYWRKEKDVLLVYGCQPKPIHKYKFIHLRIYILMDWMNWTNCGAIAQPCHVQYWVVALFLSASKNSCMISVTFHL